jgi:hypothetical protein
VSLFRTPLSCVAFFCSPVLSHILLLEYKGVSCVTNFLSLLKYTHTHIYTYIYIHTASTSIMRGVSVLYMTAAVVCLFCISSTYRLSVMQPASAVSVSVERASRAVRQGLANQAQIATRVEALHTLLDRAHNALNLADTHLSRQGNTMSNDNNNSSTSSSSNNNSVAKPMMEIPTTRMITPQCGQGNSSDEACSENEDDKVATTYSTSKVIKVDPDKLTMKPKQLMTPEQPQAPPACPVDCCGMGCCRKPCLHNVTMNLTANWVVEALKQPLNPTNHLIQSTIARIKKIEDADIGATAAGDNLLYEPRLKLGLVLNKSDHVRIRDPDYLQKATPEELGRELNRLQGVVETLVDKIRNLQSAQSNIYERVNGVHKNKTHDEVVQEKAEANRLRRESEISKLVRNEVRILTNQVHTQLRLLKAQFLQSVRELLHGVRENLRSEFVRSKETDEKLEKIGLGQLSASQFEMDEERAMRIVKEKRRINEAISSRISQAFSKALAIRERVVGKLSEEEKEDGKTEKEPELHKNEPSPLALHDALHAAAVEAQEKAASDKKKLELRKAIAEEQKRESGAQDDDDDSAEEKREDHINLVKAALGIRGHGALSDAEQELARKFAERRSAFERTDDEQARREEEARQQAHEALAAALKLRASGDISGHRNLQKLKSLLMGAKKQAVANREAEEEHEELEALDDARERREQIKHEEQSDIKDESADKAEHTEKDEEEREADQLNEAHRRIRKVVSKLSGVGLADMKDKHVDVQSETERRREMKRAEEQKATKKLLAQVADKERDSRKAKLSDADKNKDGDAAATEEEDKQEAKQREEASEEAKRKKLARVRKRSTPADSTTSLLEEGARSQAAVAAQVAASLFNEYDSLQVPSDASPADYSTMMEDDLAADALRPSRLDRLSPDDPLAIAEAARLNEQYRE